MRFSEKKSLQAEKAGKILKEINEQEKIRKYILGEIGDEARMAIEESIMTDDDYFQKLTMVEENLIQDYVDENLTAAESAKFEKCVLISNENRQKVKFARALRKYVSENENATEPRKKPSFFESLKAFLSSPVPAALGVLIILGFAGFFIWKSFFVPKDSEVIAALNKAYRTERPVESRITDLNYAPVKNTRGANDADKTDKIEFRLASEIAHRVANENKSAENLHNLGRVYLTEKKFDEAIEQLEIAVKLAPDDAKLHNDLGVALMEKAKTQQEQTLKLLTDAREEFAKAIELDKNLLDAYFNLALCLQTMPGSPQAAGAWQKYLELDSTSRWAEDARKNLNLLEEDKPVSKTKEQVLQEFLQAEQTNDHERAWQIISRNRGIAEGKLIPQQLAFLFVDAKSDSDQARAADYLKALVYAGKLEEERSGDLFWKAMANFYAGVSNDKIPILKQAETNYSNAMKKLSDENYESAITEFESAQTLYRQAGNNAEPKLLDFLIGYCQNRLSKIAESSDKLNELKEYCQKENYKWLSMQATIWLATNDFSIQKFSNCLAELESAFAIGKEIDDPSSRQKILSLFTETYTVVGQFENAFDSTEKSLQFVKLPDASPGEKWRTLNSATHFFYKLKYFHSAVSYEEEALELAQKLKASSFEYTSSIDLSRVNFALGKSDEALSLIEQGGKISETFPDGKFKNKCLAYTNLQLAHIKRQNKNYSEAAENYQNAINLYDSGEFQAFRYDAHRGLLLNYLAEKNHSAVELEMSKILEIFKDYRQKIIEEQNRNSFFDNEQDIYDIAVEFNFEKGDFNRAFDFSEESRARSLLDLQNSTVQISAKSGKKPEIIFPSNVTEPLKIAQIQAEMPEDVQLLQYTVLKDKTLIWLVTGENLIAAKAEISSDILKEKVSAYLDSIMNKNELSKQQTLSAELFNILINPVKEKLDAGKEVFIIRDKVLFKLPFNTLFSGKYLIEEYRVSYAPSANVFLVCTKKANELGAKTSENLLSIGNPTFNQIEYKNALQPLPAAKREAREVAALYKNPVVLTETDATKQRVKENFKTADVVNFAGHYVVNDREPLLSALVLAGNKKEDSDLANYEIIGEKHPQLRLIVLSACQTGVEKYYNGEGMIGASRTFLATGVPLVVASQWAVDSDANKELMVTFHRLRTTDRLPTAEALRRSQIEMLRSEKYQQPYYWAAFASIGGYTKF